MAITWGSAVTGGTGGMRLGYDIARSGSTMTIYIYVNTKYSVDDSSNTFYVTVGGSAVYDGSVAIKTTSNSGAWSDTNTVHIGTFTTTSAGDIGIYASLTGINTLGSSLKAELSVTVNNYNNVSGGTVTITDNGNNTATITGYSAANASNNVISSAKLYWLVGYWQEATVVWGGSTYFSKTVSIPSGCAQITADLYSYARVNTAHVTTTKSVKYYGDPGYPGKPVLNFRRRNPALRENVYFSWTSAASGTNVPVTGYRLRIYKNGNLLTGINPSDNSASYWDTGSTGTTFVFTSETFSFKAGDTVQLGIYSYGYDGAGNQKFNGGGVSSSHVYSDVYTFTNAAVVRLKVSGTWKEGQVYIKVGAVWKEADSVFVKQNGSWKESI